ncbi:hypothetical protein SK128_015295 [Halocaridina rubra]|uniref:Uncharacterized protein n=1 Tax=Halocaridina rubra TaxID=373956 RepID=A0AAN8ZUN6_HALRR
MALISYTLSTLLKRTLGRHRYLCAFNRCASNDTESEEELQRARAQRKTEFENEEEKWDALVDMTLLSADDVKIYEAHKLAVQRGHFTYDDPFQRDRIVKTRLRHFLRGTCCGNACRHCIYDHLNVADSEKSQRIYNSAFWVPRETRPDLVKKLMAAESVARFSDDKEFYELFRTENNNSDNEESDPLVFRH